MKSIALIIVPICGLELGLVELVWRAFEVLLCPNGSSPWTGGR